MGADGVRRSRWGAVPPEGVAAPRGSAPSSDAGLVYAGTPLAVARVGGKRPRPGGGGGPSQAVGGAPHWPPPRERARPSSPERWEATQMAMATSGVGGGGAGVSDGRRSGWEEQDWEEQDWEEDEMAEEDLEETAVEVEVVEEAPEFLRTGSSRKGKDGQIDVSGVGGAAGGAEHGTGVIRVPDGRMHRRALAGAALLRERREAAEEAARVAAQEAAWATAREARPWQDPLYNSNAEGGAGREGATENISTVELPEWKEVAYGATASVGYAVTGQSIVDLRRGLPIAAKREELVALVKASSVVVVVGETGSGKTTQLVQYLVEEGLGAVGGKKVGCTQPRRVAAVSVAERVAEEYGCRLGEEVGYSIRFEDRTSARTCIKFMTDGMLLREALLDPMLEAYSVLMLDEAHERTIHTDVLFGLLKALLKKRTDLRLVITSATLDADRFSEYFGGAPVVRIPGRAFPVDVFYLGDETEVEAGGLSTTGDDYLEAALQCVLRIHASEPPGDILVFLTGQEEIDVACEVLWDRFKRLRSSSKKRGVPLDELVVLPVYSALPQEVQTRIFEPLGPGQRKCVVATNIAEASLTIDGIVYVVDPGFSKQNVYNPRLGMDSLVVAPISQASAKQRAGRAGRTAPGKCFRLYSERAYDDEMAPVAVPELQRANLANVVLLMKALGVDDLRAFDFLDPPQEGALVDALRTLYHLGALDDEGLLTRLGRKMAEFPLDPPMAKMLIASADLACSDEALTVVAMLSVPNIFYRPRQKQAEADRRKTAFFHADGDHLTLLEVYRQWVSSGKSQTWCFKHYVHARSLGRAHEVRQQLVAVMDRYRLDIVSCGRNTDLLRKAVCSGFFYHVARKDTADGYRTVWESQAVHMHPSSSLFHRPPEWCIYHELVLTSREYMRECTRIDPRWLYELAPRFFRNAADIVAQGGATRHKRRERIAPLYDKYAEHKDDWRLSKRRM